MPQPKDDLSRSLVALEQHRTLIAVVELSLATWLVGGIVPGIERDPLKKLVPDEEGLLKLLHRWRDEAIKAGHRITRMVVAFEAGRDGFWLARWLRARGIEAYVIHPTSIAVSREQRRAKTDRLDIGLLKRSLLGWLRGEKKHCSMAAIPTLEEEDAKRPTREREQLVGKRTGIVNRMKATLVRLGIRGFNPKLRKAPEQLMALRTPEKCPIPSNTLAELGREMAHLRFIDEQIKQIEAARLEQLQQAPQQRSNARVLQLHRVNGLGIETLRERPGLDGGLPTRGGDPRPAPPLPASHVIPGALSVEVRPSASSDRCDAFRIADQKIPRVLASADDGVVAVPHQ
jgi:transposase